MNCKICSKPLEKEAFKNAGRFKGVCMTCKAEMKLERQREYNVKSIAKQKALGTYNNREETPEQRLRRLESSKLSARKRIANETPEQKEERLRKSREQRLKRIANETPEQKEERLAYGREALKKFNEKNKGKGTEYNKIWLSDEKNKEKKREQNRRYKEKNKEKMNAYNLSLYHKKREEKKAVLEAEKVLLFELMEKIEKGLI
ncbi:MAG: hypothetical protein ACRC5T_02425 [Cetobacterium sp.]